MTNPNRTTGQRTRLRELEDLLRRAEDLCDDIVLDAPERIADKAHVLRRDIHSALDRAEDTNG